MAEEKFCPLYGSQSLWWSSMIPHIQMLMPLHNALNLNVEPTCKLILTNRIYQSDWSTLWYPIVIKDLSQQTGVGNSSIATFGEVTMCERTHGKCQMASNSLQSGPLLIVIKKMGLQSYNLMGINSSYNKNYFGSKRWKIYTLRSVGGLDERRWTD